MAADNRCIGDWRHHYLNRFVDRDMLMRFTGMAIGHMTLSCNNKQRVAPPAEALDSGYEYIDTEPEEQGEALAAGDDDGDDETDNELEEGEEEGTSEHGSDDDELVDQGEGTNDDEDNEVSW
ncbi:hypothetical protein FRC06_008819 [Ceratobasidium sp. 370]|nr:hypothetical protein FRC06_008819 [Ceratobasidium sp. 370]